MTLPLTVVRHSDNLSALYAQLPEQAKQELNAAWTMAQAEEVDPSETAEFNMAFAMLKAPGAADNLMAMAQPQLNNIQPQLWAAFLPMIQMQLQAQVQQMQDPEAKATVEQFLPLFPAIQTWLATWKGNDPALLKEALEKLAAFAQSRTWSTAEELKAMSLEQVIPEIGALISTMKDVLEIYDLPLDQFVDNFKVTADGTNRPLAMKFLASPFRVKAS